MGTRFELDYLKAYRINLLFRLNDDSGEKSLRNEIIMETFKIDRSCWLQDGKVHGKVADFNNGPDKKI